MIVIIMIVFITLLIYINLL